LSKFGETNLNAAKESLRNKCILVISTIMKERKKDHDRVPFKNLLSQEEKN